MSNAKKFEMFLFVIYVVNMRKMFSKSIFQNSNVGSYKENELIIQLHCIFTSILSTFLIISLIFAFVSYFVGFIDEISNIFVYVYGYFCKYIFFVSNCYVKPEIILGINPTELNPTKYFVHRYRY